MPVSLEPAAVLDPHPSGDHERAESIVFRCLDATLRALHDTAAARDKELNDARRAFEDAYFAHQAAEVLDLVARFQGADEYQVSTVIARLSAAVASTMSVPPVAIPFASKLIAPSSFYESFTQILHLARQLLVPVIFAEDTDAIGTGSINPVAARCLADEIVATVDRRFGIKPFLTVVRVDYESWTFLTRKHFGL
jgi:hypothetical protein